MLKLVFALPLVLSLALVACSDDDSSPTSTPTQPGNSATATTQPATTATAPVTGTPPVDGTVPAGETGDTDPVSLDADPAPQAETAVLNEVRVGEHPEAGGWDRIVFEFEDARPTAAISYEDAVSRCGSGDAVDLDGEATLQVIFEMAQAHTEAGQPTVNPSTIDGPGNSILESAQICDFEGQVIWAIGVESEKNFTVTTLTGPTRVVIDVKH